MRQLLVRSSLAGILLGFLAYSVLKQPPSVDEQLQLEYYSDVDGDGYGDPNSDPIVSGRFLSEVEEKRLKLRPIGRDKNNRLLKDEMDCHDNDKTTYPCSEVEGGSNCGIPWPQCH